MSNKNNKNGAKSDNQAKTSTEASTEASCCGSADIFHPTIKVTELTPALDVPESPVVMEEKYKGCILESGIPIPAPTRGSKKYPFDKMESGQSFVIGKKVGAVSVTINYWKKKMPGRTFVSRSLPENELWEMKSKKTLGEDVQFACRVWRTDGLVAVE